MGEIANTRQMHLERRLPSYWRVTFNHPPLNIFGPESIPQLNEVVVALETDEDVKVVVFDSAVDGFFLTRYDFLAKLEDSTSMPPGPTGLHPLPDMLARSVAPQPCQSSRFAGGPPASAASSLWRPTCASRAAKGRSCRNGSLEPASCPAAGRWPDCRA